MNKVQRRSSLSFGWRLKTRFKIWVPPAALHVFARHSTVSTSSQPRLQAASLAPWQALKRQATNGAPSRRACICSAPMPTCALVPFVAVQAVEKINAQVKAGNHYEAQQMYKTVYHRYHSRKQLPESYQILQVG